MLVLSRVVGETISIGDNICVRVLAINGNHVRAVSKGTLTVTSVPVFTGRTMAVWQTEIRTDRDKLVCTSRCSFLLQRKPAFQGDLPEKLKSKTENDLS